MDMKREKTKQDNQDYTKQAQQFIIQFKEQLENEEKYIITKKKLDYYDEKLKESFKNGGEKLAVQLLRNMHFTEIKNNDFSKVSISSNRAREIELEAVWMAENYVRNLPLRSIQVKHIIPLHIQVKGDWTYKENMKKYFPNKI